mgnify:FL=1
MNDILTARLTTLEIFYQVRYKKQNLDDTFERLASTLDLRDKSFVRMLATTAMRRCGQIEAILASLMARPLPNKAKFVQGILILGACQILFMQTAPHAAVSTAVDMAKAKDSDFYTKLINGVLRNLCRHKNELLEKFSDPALNVPDWLYKSWQKAYGVDEAKRIAAAFLNEPATFISVKKDPDFWAQKLNGKVTQTGSIELPSGVYVPHMEGFMAGDWWVQDQAASIPVQLFGDLKGKKVADFCAAPGGKTAALLAQGADVDAFDISEKRLERIKENLNRLGYTTNLIALDANRIKGQEIYDAILIDAPCSATGTIMRHPDLYFHRTPEDVAKLSIVQKKLLKTAHRLLKNDGLIVYCTCSLQPDEGEKVIASFADVYTRVPITNARFKPFLTPEGDIRTFPYQGMDGFFATLLKKKLQ